MSVRIIPLRVDNEFIREEGSGFVVGASGSHDEVVFKISFGEAWEGLTKKVVMLNSRGANAIFVDLTPTFLGEDGAYLVPVPAEPKEFPGQMTLTIKGFTIEDEIETLAILTNAAKFTVLESEWDENAEEAADITPDQASQILAAIDTLIGDYNDFIQHIHDAEAWAVGTIDGEPVDQEDPRYQNNSKYYAQQAGSSATSAGSSATSASESAATATAAATTATQQATAAGTAATAAQTAASHYPYIGDNKHWYVWDVTTAQYVDTGEVAVSFTFIHRQMVPAATWEIEHDLGKYPAVIVVDSAGTVVAGDTTYINENNVKVSFQSAFSGTAYLN